MTYTETIQKAINRFSRDITKGQTEKGITQKQLATEIGCRDNGSALSRLRLYGKCSQQLVLALCEYFKLKYLLTTNLVLSLNLTISLTSYRPS